MGRPRIVRTPLEAAQAASDGPGKRLLGHLLDHLVDIAVGFFGLMFLGFLVADIVRDDVAGIANALVTLAALGAIWAVARASLNRRR